MNSAFPILFLLIVGAVVVGLVSAIGLVVFLIVRKGGRKSD